MKKLISTGIIMLIMATTVLASFGFPDQDQPKINQDKFENKMYKLINKYDKVDERIDKIDEKIQQLEKRKLMLEDKKETLYHKINCFDWIANHYPNERVMPGEGNCYQYIN